MWEEGSGSLNIPREYAKISCRIVEVKSGWHRTFKSDLKGIDDIIYLIFYLS